MKSIVLNNVIGGSYSSIDGYSLYCILKPYFINGERLMISMQDFSAMSSSFFNSSFGELIEEFGIDKFRENIKFVNLTNSQAKLISRYLEFRVS